MSKRHRPSRRTAIQTLAALGTIAIATPVAAGTSTQRDGTRADTSHRPNTAADDVDGATRYVAVVDRIVDGEHVVLLLEKDGELVDQRVEPRSSFDDVAESDILIVVIRDGDLLAARQIPKRPGRGCRDDQQERFDDIAEPLS